MSFSPRTAHVLLKPLYRILPPLACGLLMLGSLTASVLSDCRPQTAGASSGLLCTSLIGGPGDNELMIETDTVITGAIFGDGILSGKASNDTLINDGVTQATSSMTGSNGDMEGDVIALGDGGHDMLVNNGTVAGDMDGDTALNGSGGSDVLINNGVVEDDMDGDNASANGGDDTLVINGSVGGDIEGDDNSDAAGSVGGDDLIVINGTVGGKVEGDFGVQTGGDDVVVLQNGANGGSDSRLELNGGDGNDTLIVNFMVVDRAAYDRLGQQIAVSNPRRGALDYNGQTFVWDGFEQIVNQITSGGAEPLRVTMGGRGRALFDSTAQAALYCRSTGISLTQSDLRYPLQVGSAALTTGLEQAAAANTPVKLAAANDQTLWAAADGTLRLQTADGRYSFMTEGSFCSASF